MKSEGIQRDKTVIQPRIQDCNGRSWSLGAARATRRKREAAIEPVACGVAIRDVGAHDETGGQGFAPGKKCAPPILGTIFRRRVDYAGARTS